MVAVDGALRGSTLHRGLAVAFGALMVVPLALVARRGDRARRLARTVAFAAVPATALLLAAEPVVRAAGLRPYRNHSGAFDPVLGARGVPHDGDLDARGFRNEEVPERVDLLCIGDSNTFGFHLAASETWPHALGRRLRATVYNMSHGGYGPLQYAALAREAASLEPRAVVVAFYFGNDLLDAHDGAGLAAWARMRDPAVAYGAGPSPIAPAPAPNLAMAAFDWLTEHSVLAAAAREAVMLRLRAARFLNDAHGREPGAPAHRQGRVRTLFTPALRAGALDLDRVEVRDGLRITRLALRELRDSCAPRPVVLLLLHTKEACYHALAAGRGEAAPGLERLAALEAAATVAVVDAARAAGIVVVDPIAALVAALAADHPCFAPTADGHYNARACEILAEAAAAALGGELSAPGPR
jgi:hypothetical protein